MNLEKSRMPSYGGQALIEGVLMRGKKYVTAAYRSPDGKIILGNEKLSGIYNSKINKIPFLRGLTILWDAIGLGTKYISRSANIQAGEDEKIDGATLGLTVVISFLLAIGLFFLLPTGLVSILQKFTQVSAFYSNILEGFIRLLFILLYIWAVGKSKDIRRVFTYHGAEHKTINAYESGAVLNCENVARHSLYHPRCGTGFILILVFFSIIVFSALGPIDNIILRLASRILFLPVLVMLAYEFMRFSANHVSTPILKYLSYPGMLMQRLTTFEPTPDILEVSISAFNNLLELENDETVKP